MTFKPFAALAASILMSGCLAGPVVTDPQAQQGLVTRECAIYVAAERRPQAEGRPVAGLSEGCPSGIAPGNIQPTGVTGQATAFSEILFRRMIARGMPRDLAGEVSISPAFWDLVAFQAANAS